MPGAARVPSPRDPPACRTPIILLTASLDHCKTTLLSRLLRHPVMNPASVIIH